MDQENLVTIKWISIQLIFMEFFSQTKFGARCRAWNVAQFNQDSPPTIRLRLDDELNVPVITNDFTVKDKKEVLG